MHTIKIKDQNILLLSDTHGKHRLIDTPKNIQMVIHCGDICNAGDMDEHCITLSSSRYFR
jgi:predicted phosphodiesterase